MRNRIAGISTQSQAEQLDEELLHERIADEHCRLSAIERRQRRRMARRKQVLFMRRIMRLHMQAASTRDWAS